MRDLFQEFVLKPINHSINAFAFKKAFFIGGEYFTYKQFGEAIEIQRKIVKNQKESVVPLEIRDDLETYAAIFACWMENKAYVPLNPNQPKERNREIMTQISTVNNVEFEDSLAYVLFTSGSTGVPKGVAISRMNLGAFMDSFWKTGIWIDENDRCLQCFDLTFDVSVQSFLVALTRGACVYTVPYGQVKYLQVAALIHEQHITFGAMAPSMLTYLRPYFDELDASDFRTCILTAEACPVDLIEDWLKCAKNVEVYDFYGPTEATVYCTCYKCVRGEVNLSVNGIVSIGKPLANVETVIVDDAGEVLMECGVKGELCVAGGQVTQGYWNNEAKNASAFSEILVDGTLKRFYHTGDLCYWDMSGNLMYVGRIDQQVKIQGFRVELSEIEHQARSFYGGEIRVAAVAFENRSRLTEIALFVEGESDSMEKLKAYLREKMPAYMMPSRIICVDVFPLNNNDKIDRNKLLSQL